MTIGEKLELARNRPAGFDYLRIILAISVVVSHTTITTYGEAFQRAIWTTPQYRVLLCFILPAFFTLSGFLIAGSLERCQTVAGFLYLRAIRIFPALIVEILLSAFILGPLMTDLSLHEYFHHHKLYSYLLNCLGFIHYILPGVFTHNPFPDIVNQQLWTVPFELDCYISIALLAFLGIVRKQWLFMLVIALVLTFTGLQYLLDIYYARDTTPLASLTGYELVLCFLVGVLFYNLRAFIPHSLALCLIAMTLACVCFLVKSGDYLAPLPVVYATVFLGTTNPPRIKLLESGDYSYGIFLYGFPIQQTVVATGLVASNGLVTLSVALPLIILAAVCSWHFWEKHLLKLRKFRPRIDSIFYFTRPELAESILFKTFGRDRKKAVS